MRLVGQGAGETTALHKIQMRSAVQRWNINNALISMKPESAPLNSSDDTGRSETVSAVHDCAVLIMQLFKSGAERYEKKVVKLLHRRGLQLRSNSNCVEDRHIVQ